MISRTQEYPSDDFSRRLALALAEALRARRRAARRRVRAWVEAPVTRVAGRRKRAKLCPQVSSADA